MADARHEDGVGQLERTALALLTLFLRDLVCTSSSLELLDVCI
jgi:hypothetical protein